MGRMHNAVAAAAFVCGTGCDPVPETFELTPDQKAEVQQEIDDGSMVLPLFDQLADRLDQDAVFGAKGEETKTAFSADLRQAHALVKRYQEEGRIVGFDPDAVDTIEGVAAFLRDTPIEGDQYIAVGVREGHISGVGFGDLFHEGGHNVTPQHSKAVQKYIQDSLSKGESFETEEFSLLIEEEKDYSYLLSVLGELPHRVLSEARWELSGVTYTESQLKYSTPEQVYSSLTDLPLGQDQLTWATYVVDESLDYGEESGVWKGLGLTREDLIDVFAHETSIYPEMHAEYMEYLEEFRQEHDIPVEARAEQQPEQETEYASPSSRR